MAWLTGWNFRKKITLTPVDNAGTNYQVKFSVLEGLTPTSYASLTNPSFETDAVDTTYNSITGWSWRDGVSTGGYQWSYWEEDDPNLNWASAPNATDCRIVTSNYYVGAKSLKLYNKSGIGCTPRGGVIDFSQTVDLTGYCKITLWMKHSYTTPSRYTTHFAVILGDGTTEIKTDLFCHSASACEGCVGGCYDNYVTSATGADSTTWYKYEIPIDPSLDKSSIKIRLSHMQDAWDSSNCGETTIYIDNIELIKPVNAVYCDNEALDFPTTKDDSGDLRFTSSDGSTLLDMWVEDVTSAQATIWTEVTEDLSTDKDVYLYYGKSSASNVSSGDNTFLFFDDFLGTTLDSTKWDSANSVTVGSDYVSLDRTTTDPQINTKTAFSFYASPFRVYAKYQHPSRYRNRLFLTTSTSGGSPTGYDYGIFDPTIYWNGYSGISLAINTWYFLEWINKTADYTWRIFSNNLPYDIQTGVVSYAKGSAISDLKYLQFYGASNSASDFKVDYVYITKYVASEPYASLVGSQETEGANLICQINVIPPSHKLLVSRVKTLLKGTKNLISREKTLITDTLNLISRIEAQPTAVKNLVSSISVIALYLTKNIVSRIIVLKETSINLISRVKVLLKNNENLISRVSIPGVGSKNLISRIDVYNVDLASKNIVSRITVSRFRDIQPSKITDYNFGNLDITCFVREQGYLWIGLRTPSGNCKIRKVSAYNLNTTYFEMSLPLNVAKIVRMRSFNSKIYCILEDNGSGLTAFFWAWFSLSNPRGSYSYITKPVGAEYPVDFVERYPTASTMGVLTPGTYPVNSKIYVYNTSTNALVTTANLITINEAYSITANKTAGDFWVSTHSDPIKLIRVYLSGAVYLYTTTIIT